MPEFTFKAIGVLAGFCASGYIYYRIVRKAHEDAMAVHTHQVIMLKDVSDAGATKTPWGAIIQDPFAPGVRITTHEEGIDDAGEA